MYLHVSWIYGKLQIVMQSAVLECIWRNKVDKTKLMDILSNRIYLQDI